MKIKELISILNNLPPEKEIMVVASDMGEGTDVYAPLDDVNVNGEFVMLGSTVLMCGQGSIPALSNFP